MRFDDVVDQIRCPDCGGAGSANDERHHCERCNGSGINPAALEEASGWDTWAMSVHDNPGWFVSVYLGLTDPTGNAPTLDLRSNEQVDETSV